MPLLPKFKMAAATMLDFRFLAIISVVDEDICFEFGMVINIDHIWDSGLGLYCNQKSHFYQI